MKQAIRALGWATTTLWILTILFSGTVVYSAMQIGMNFEEEPQVTSSNGALMMSIPFSIRNGGLYDITELNITTRIVAENETIISSSSSFIATIPKGSTVSETHQIVVSLDDILAKELTYMLFNDTNLNVDMFIALIYAYALPLKISSNLTMPWGAPIYNLIIGEISVVPPNQVNVPLSFENHAFFDLNGTVSLELVDKSNNQIGSGTASISVPPGGNYDKPIPITITGNPLDVAEVHLRFNTTLFSVGPVVIDVN